MPRQPKTPKRMKSDHQRMPAAELRPGQIWATDSWTPEFAEKCRRKALEVAASDPAGDELMRFIAEVYGWPRA